MTTYTLENTDTGEVLDTHIITAEVARLDGAAAPAWFGGGTPDGWTPKDPYASMRCGCGKVHESALIAPTAEELAAEGSTIAEEMTRGVDRKPGWATWLGEIHHADAEWADIVAPLRAMPDQYAAPPIERTVVEPVRVDYSYRQSEAWTYAETVVSLSRQRDSVYAELAPERIQAGPDHPPPEHERQGNDPDLTPEHERQVDRESLDRMVKRVPTVISAQRPPRDTSGDVTLADYIRSMEAAEQAEPDGWVPATWWRRALAWIGGAR